MSTTVRPSRALDDSGFSIVETLFAIVIMAIAFLGMAGVQAVSSKAQTLGRNHDVATALVAQALEQAHRTSFPAITSGSSTTDAAGTRYSLARTVSTLGAAKRVEAVASWTDRFGLRTLRMATIVSQVTNP